MPNTNIKVKKINLWQTQILEIFQLQFQYIG